MSAEFREIAEYIERFAAKENITVEQALDYIMPKLFASYKKDQGNNKNGGE